MKKFVAIIVLFFAFLIYLPFSGLMVDKEGARQLLKKQGYTNIETGGYAWFSCGKEDFYATQFEATNSSGNRVSGAVCTGLLFKNSTIRFQ